MAGSGADDNGPAVVVSALGKRFGTVEALRDVSFEVARGTVLGLLGPNGAGKTTTVRILTTLVRPDRGQAAIEGFDVVRQASEVRELIGLAGQSTAIQDELTGRENLEIIGRLAHLGRRRARARAEELLERFGLAEAADRRARTYSGGMQRRLDLAASLVGSPAVLFLDEPTTGLDPKSRLDLWGVIRELVAGGTTLVLTTQYLEEADALADDVVVVDHGTVIAAGTPEALKDRVGGAVLEFAVVPAARLPEAAELLLGVGDGPPVLDEQEARLSLPLGQAGTAAVVAALRRLDEAGLTIDGLALRRPSLDDVFLTLTGHRAEQPGGPGEVSGQGPRRHPEARSSAGGHSRSPR